MFDYWQARFDNYWRSRQKPAVRPPVPAPVMGLRSGESPPRGKALLVFMPDPVRAWQGGGTPRFFNPHGASLEWAKGLMRMGYETDVLHYEDTRTEIAADYRLVVAHVGPAISRIIKSLPANVPVIRYATTAHWRWFDEQTSTRYRNLAARKAIPDLPLPTRLLCPEEEEALDRRANLIACLGQMTTRKFQEAGLNAVCMHNAAYSEPASDEEIARKASNGRGFLYQGGSACVQKGLDLLLEAFSQEPDIHLYLDSLLEPDILACYRREISRPNIHFVRFSLRRRDIRDRVESNCPFLIYSGLNSGQSTAMVAGTAKGRIPVVTESADIPWREDIISIETPDVDAIRSAIRFAASLPDKDILRMTMATRNGFNQYFTQRNFADSVDRVLRLGVQA